MLERDGLGRRRRRPRLRVRPQPRPAGAGTCAACAATCAARTPARAPATCRPRPAACARGWSASPASSAATSRAAGAASSTWATRRSISHTCLLFSDRQYRERDAWNARELAPRFDRPGAVRPGGGDRLDAGLVADAAAERATCRPPSAISTIRRTHDTAFCWAAPTATRPATRWRRRSCRASWSWSSATASPCGGTTASAGRPSIWTASATRTSAEVRSVPAQAPPRPLGPRPDLRPGHPGVRGASRRTDGGPEQILFGFGAHLDAQVALLRAVTEMNQMLGHAAGARARRGGGRAHQRPEDGRLAARRRRWRTSRTCCRWTVRPRTPSSYPHVPDRRHATEDVLACQALVEGRAWKCWSWTRRAPEIGLPVVKVIVPGLRHFWARFAPGRLYDVPVQLGWLPRPLAEEELNPDPDVPVTPGGSHGRVVDAVAAAGGRGCGRRGRGTVFFGPFSRAVLAASAPLLGTLSTASIPATPRAAWPRRSDGRRTGSAGPVVPTSFSIWRGAAASSPPCIPTGIAWPP